MKKLKNIFKNYRIGLFFLPLSLWGQSNSYPLPPPQITELSLEYAKTKPEACWGLMQRKNLPENSGMLFCYQDESILTLWMFNTFIDLSVAFIDKNHVIREIYEMKAYPHLMNQTFPVKNRTDLDLISSADPVVSFFLRQATASKYPAQYVLEMNKNWFAEKKVKVGDVILWDGKSSKAQIIQTLNVGELLSEANLPVKFQLSQKGPLSLFAPNENRNYHITFYDQAGKVLKRELLRGGKHLPLARVPVLYCANFTMFSIVQQ